MVGIEVGGEDHVPGIDKFRTAEQLVRQTRVTNEKLLNQLRQAVSPNLLDPLFAPFQFAV